MPAHSMPVVAIKPANRPDDWDDEQWIFPGRLEEVASKLGLSRLRIAELAKVSTSTVTRWLHYESPVNLLHVIRIEKALGVAPGTMTRSILDETPRPPESSVRESKGDPLTFG